MGVVDNSGGTAYSAERNLGDAAIFGTGLSTGFAPPGNGVLTNYSTIFTIGDANGPASALLTQGLATESQVFTGSLNTDATLSLVAYPNDGSELHRFDSVSVLIEGDVTAVPLPAPIMLLLTGLFGLAYLGRRRSS